MSDTYANQVLMKEGRMDLLLYNNLVINYNSKRYRPFLFNLVSGRRRLLSEAEFELIKSRETCGENNEEWRRFFYQLIGEKQFLTDEMRTEVEKSLIDAGYWIKRNNYAEDYRFSIELTRDCNMKCSFCYAKNRGEAEAMTPEKIDAIYRFYEKYADDSNKIQETPYIRITGGEPLVTEESALMIRYIAEKWKKAKIDLFTNGMNLKKYFNCLPVERFNEVVVSLDGPKEIHLKHRMGNSKLYADIYKDILNGIKLLLEKQVKVRINTILDRYNYLYFGELKELLLREGILNDPNCSQTVNVTIDFKNELGIKEEVNNAKDVRIIEKYLEKFDVSLVTYQSEQKLKSIMARQDKGPYLPSCTRCHKERLANYYFGCDGKVYHCDCVAGDEGLIGSFYPEAHIEEDNVSEIYNSTILDQTKCKSCTYKFVCLGGCSLNARGKGLKMDCGIFEHEDIMDNIEFDYYGLLRYDAYKRFVDSERRN